MVIIALSILMEFIDNKRANQVTFVGLVGLVGSKL